MKYCIFDTETTGLGATDEVIQFCCMIFENSLLNNTKFIDFYCMSTIEINPKAIAVHNLTVDKLYELSGKKFFEEQFDGIRKYLDGDIVFIGYNINFDMRKINATLKNANLPSYDFGANTRVLGVESGRYHFDVMTLAKKLMKGSTKNFTQSEVLKSIPEFDENDFNKMYRDYIREVLSSNPKLKYDTKDDFHNARYDVFALWYITTYLCPEIIK
jgi:DNA polymerase III epsilon subunit-like protein